MGSENNFQSEVHVLCEQSKWDELLYILNSILDADNNNEAVISDDDDDDAIKKEESDSIAELKNKHRTNVDDAIGWATSSTSSFICWWYISTSAISSRNF